jgi:uncharacterized membrane protein YphA (DoxX/SURF4 family)
MNLGLLVIRLVVGLLFAAGLLTPLGAALLSAVMLTAILGCSPQRRSLDHRGRL